MGRSEYATNAAMTDRQMSYSAFGFCVELLSLIYVFGTCAPLELHLKLFLPHKSAPELQLPLVIGKRLCIALPQRLSKPISLQSSLLMDWRN